MNLYTTSKSYITPNFLNLASEYVGEELNYVQQIVEGTLPVILLGLTHKLKTQEGGEELLSFLKEHTLSKVDLNNIDTIFEDMEVLKAYQQTGADSLLLLFGDRINVNISFDFSIAFPVEASSAISLMNLASPILLGVIAKVLTQKGETVSTLQNLLEGHFEIGKTNLPQGVAYSLKPILEPNNHTSVLQKGKKKSKETNASSFYEEIKMKIPKWVTSF
ncbi:MAG: DUF937 domain-containing protein [Flectobacillus sp.]|nr:DUF937 domain-containing protein [Flectobacillus sp.]